VSRPTPIFTGSIDGEGKLWLEAKGLFKGYLRSLKNKPVQVVVKVLQRRKSQSQLGYLWGVVYPVIAEHFGYMDYEHEAMHDEIMRVLRGLKPEPNPLKIRVSLAEMSHEDVSAYITDVRHWAAIEHGIVTPDADRVEFKERGKKRAA
jgi:hypothetical protein